MPAISLIGPDGAGKTTICRLLEQSFGLPLKYLYMGTSIQSSNVTLPAARLFDKIKSSGRFRRKSKKGAIWLTLRLLYRLSEEWYRQMLSWSYQLRGYVVIYDRHFFFDYVGIQAPRERLSDRLHCWMLDRIYPRPDLVIYLDAPPELLFARKQDAPLEFLRSRRQAFLRLEKQIPNFIKVDAIRPLDQVYSEVNRQILDFCQRTRAVRLSERL